MLIVCSSIKKIQDLVEVRNLVNIEKVNIRPTNKTQTFQKIMLKVPTKLVVVVMVNGHIKS